MTLGRPRYSFTGLAGATVLFCLSLTPSLLPRGHVLQGLVSGLLAAIGYGLGVLGVWLVRHLTTRELPQASRAAWRWLAGIAAVVAAVFLYLGSGWQHDIHELMGIDPPARFGFPIVLVIAALLAAAPDRPGAGCCAGPHNASPHCSAGGSRRPAPGSWPGRSSSCCSSACSTASCWTGSSPSPTARSAPSTTRPSRTSSRPPTRCAPAARPR